MEWKIAYWTGGTVGLLVLTKAECATDENAAHQTNFDMKS